MNVPSIHAAIPNIRQVLGGDAEWKSSPFLALLTLDPLLFFFLINNFILVFARLFLLIPTGTASFGLQLELRDCVIIVIRDTFSFRVNRIQQYSLFI